MNDDKLKSLLRDAELGIERPNLAPADLAGLVRRQDCRRRRRTRILLTAVPAMAVDGITAAWSLWPKGAPLPVANRVTCVTFDIAEIERLEAEARFHERVARDMVAGQKRDRALEEARRASATDPLDEVRERIDVVAYRMIQRADALRTEMDPPQEAIRVYRDVERLFPATHSAELARLRLNELGLSEGET